MFDLKIEIRNKYYDVIDIYHFKHYVDKVNHINRHLYNVVAVVDSFGERTFILTRSELEQDLIKKAS
jgi:hypothetical protein